MTVSSISNPYGVSIIHAAAKDSVSNTSQSSDMNHITCMDEFLKQVHSSFLWLSFCTHIWKNEFAEYRKSQTPMQLSQHTLCI